MYHLVPYKGKAFGQIRA